MSAAAKKLVREKTFKAYFAATVADTSQSGPGQFEIGHLVQLSVVPAKLWDTRDSGALKLFKQDDANWLFFFLFADHFKSRATGKEGKFIVKL